MLMTPKCHGSGVLKFFRLEIQAVMLVFSTQLCKLLPLSPSLINETMHFINPDNHVGICGLFILKLHLT